MKTEFDDALRGMHHEYDEVRPQEEDQYRAIGSLSITSFVFGLLSFTSIIFGTLLIVPLLGLIFGVLSARKIIAMPTIMGGLKLTVAGMILSFVFGCVGIWSQYHNYYHATPAGYAKIDFYKIAAGDSGAIPNEIMALNDQKVFIEGHMYPQKQQDNIEKFALVRTLQSSSFAGTPDPTDMILVEIKTGQKLDYRAKPIRIGGTLKVRRNFSYEKLPYTIEADIVR